MFLMMFLKSKSFVIFVVGLMICEVRKRFVDGQVVTFQIEQPAVYNRVLFEGENVRLSCIASNLPTGVNNDVFITIGNETLAASVFQATKPGGMLYWDITSIPQGEHHYYCLVEYFDDTKQVNVTLREDTNLTVYSTTDSPQCIHDASSSTIFEGDNVNLYCYYSSTRNQDAKFAWQESCGMTPSILNTELINLNESRTSVLKTKDGILTYFGNETGCYFICIDSSTSESCNILIEKKSKLTSPTSPEVNKAATVPLSDIPSDRGTSVTTTLTATTVTATGSVTTNNFTTAAEINQASSGTSPSAETTLLSDRDKVMTTTQPQSDNPLHYRDSTTIGNTVTPTATNNIPSNNDSRGILIGLLVLVGILIILVFILIMLHLFDRRKRRKKTLKRVSTISQHIYENPSFRNHVFGSLPRSARNSPQMSRLSKQYLGSFGAQDDVASSQTSLASAEVKVKKSVADPPQELRTKNEVLALQSTGDIQNSDDANSESFDGESIHTTSDLDLSDHQLNGATDHPDNLEDDTYVDMQDTLKRDVMKETESYTTSHEETDNNDAVVSNDGMYTSPTEYSRSESHDDTYGMHVSVSDGENFTSSRENISDYSPPVSALGQLSEVAEYEVNDFKSLYAIVVKSKSPPENRDRVEKENPAIEEQNNDNEHTVSSPLYDRRLSKSNQVERPKFAPPAPPTKRN